MRGLAAVGVFCKPGLSVPQHKFLSVKDAVDDALLAGQPCRIQVRKAQKLAAQVASGHAMGDQNDGTTDLGQQVSHTGGNRKMPFPAGGVVHPPETVIVKDTCSKDVLATNPLLLTDRDFAQPCLGLLHATQFRKGQNSGAGRSGLWAG